MAESIDPNIIENEDVRQIVVKLMNLVEKQQVIIAEQAAEIQRLRDEVNRLKGEQGKPKIRGNKKASELSSEKERRESKPHDKSSKQESLKIDREVYLKVDRKRLPADAVFKGYEEVVVQDLECHTDQCRRTLQPADQRPGPLPCRKRGGGQGRSREFSMAASRQHRDTGQRD